MPPGGAGELNVIVRVGKVKGATERRSDRTVLVRKLDSMKEVSDILSRDSDVCHIPMFTKYPDGFWLRRLAVALT